MQGALYVGILREKICRKKLENEFAHIKKQFTSVKRKKYAISIQCMQSAIWLYEYKKQDLSRVIMQSASKVEVCPY
jgi:type IV secretory pathway component VirB8